ncbi:nucleotidyltransferase family protein [Streptomyces sp. NPDC004126]|uniref:nucleotidyltransferase family protein n=1 Tax=Streptomyces sp. NPDC004126 TaxID=3390695 RepID=UPI003D095891
MALKTSLIKPATPHDRDDLIALMSLAVLQPRFSVERSIAAVEAVGGEEAARILGNHRTRSIVMPRLAPYAESSPAVAACMEAIRPRATRIREMHGLIEENLKRLDDIAREHGIELFAIKGLGARVTYPDPGIRDFGDLDLFVRRRADAYFLSQLLRREYGHVYNPNELPWFKYDPAAGLLYGQINLLAPEGGSELNIDLHFGDYSVRHCARIGLADVLPRHEPGLEVIAPEENLACCVNNAAGDYFVTAKDVNDLLMALALPAFDVSRFEARLRHSGLGEYFGFIVARLREVCVLTPAQEARLRSLPSARTLEPTPELDGPHWTRRCLGTTVHAYRVNRREGRVRALRIAADAYGYYRDRLKLEVVPAAPGQEPPALELNPWTCVRLVPAVIAHELAADRTSGPGQPAALFRRTQLLGDPGVVRHDGPAGTVVRVDGEYFVPTVDYRLPRDLVEQAWALHTASGC